MKQKILTSLLLIMTIILSSYAQNTISVLGFGEIPYEKNGSNYTVKFKKFGAFDFRGSVKPLSLETTVTIDRLKKNPRL